MTRSLPRRSREYRSYAFDSRNWDLIAPREGDVVITTSYKSGTTWMQNIVLRLIFQDGEVPAVSVASPWIDWRRADTAELVATLTGQTHRRVIKSHLALDGIPYRTGTRYIVVVRDARDVFMSLWNHMSEMRPEIRDYINSVPDRVGPEMLPPPTDIHAFWTDWINRGWFPWESEGYPHSGNMSHTQSWWNFRHLPNILFVHFNDLLADAAGQVRRVAGHLGIAVTGAAVARIVEETGFAALQANADKAGPTPPSAMEATWTGGARTFFFKGTNGRWRGVLTAEELEMYRAAKRRVLTEDCAAYMEGGRGTDIARPGSEAVERAWAAGR
jgi:aryl sulfotransferase